MDEGEVELQCPRCGAEPVVQIVSLISGWVISCHAHAIGYEAWGETFAEAEAAWIKYCTTVRSKNEEKENGAGKLDAAQYHALKAFLIKYENPALPMPPQNSFAMMVIKLLNTAEEVMDHDSD